MPLETGTYLQDLDQSNPAGGDDRSQGDNHLRLIKSTLKNTFPNASKAFRFPTTAASVVSALAPTFPDDQNKLFPISAAGGAITVTLPDTTAGGTVHEDGFNLGFVKTDSSANTIVISPASGKLINGATSLTLTSQWEQAYLTWCKTTSQWIALTPSIMQHLQLKAAANLLQLWRTENDTVEREIESVLSGSGSGNKYSRRLVGDAGNSVNLVREYIGSTKLSELATSYKRFFEELQIWSTSLGQATIALNPAGYVDLLQISPGDPVAGYTRFYGKSLNGVTHLAYRDNDGLETVVGGGALLAIIQDEKSSGVAAQTITSGDWRTRELNTINFDRSGSFVLNTNQIIFPAGSYDITWITEVGSAPGNHKSRLFNVTGGTTIAVGSGSRVQSDAGDNVDVDVGMAFSIGHAAVTFDGVKAVTVQQQFENTEVGGRPAGFGIEVYTKVIIRSL